MLLRGFALLIRKARGIAGEEGASDPVYARLLHMLRSEARTKVNIRYEI
jgi:hypothetical protein